MPCFHPLSAWRGGKTANGKNEILFKRPKVESASLIPFKLPCGQCTGCRLERSRQWAMRCVHEASLHEQNSFLTLTYDGSHLPKSGSLVKKDFVLFMKRLRKSIEPKKIRFFHCGEYGEKYNRPHDHVLIFGHDFADKAPYKKTPQGHQLYQSKTLTDLWEKGNAWIGSVSFESAAYVARYIMKKVTGKDAIYHYVNEDTGEVLEPEYVTMSRRPGIGKKYFEKFTSDMYPRDYAIMRGKKMHPPKYYDGLYEMMSPLDYSCMKIKRVRNAFKVDPTGFGENGAFRLAVKEEVKMAQMRSLTRGLEA